MYLDSFLDEVEKLAKSNKDSVTGYVQRIPKVVPAAMGLGALAALLHNKGLLRYSDKDMPKTLTEAFKTYKHGGPILVDVAKATAGAGTLAAMVSPKKQEAIKDQPVKK